MVALFKMHKLAFPHVLPCGESFPALVEDVELLSCMYTQMFECKNQSTSLRCFVKESFSLLTDACLLSSFICFI